MSAGATYAAVHVGDGSLSLLFSRGDDVVECQRPTSGYIVRSVTDARAVVGSSAVPTTKVLVEAFAAMFDDVGATGDIDVLEIACPAVWGTLGRRAVHAAVRTLARDVVMSELSTAAIHSVGQRLPAFAVTVELAELESVVTAVSVGPENTVEWTGAWAAVGTLDLIADAAATESVRDRVAATVAAKHVRGPVDVFVVGGESVELDSLVGDRAHRVRHVSGPEVVRALAARAGIGQYVPPPSNEESVVAGDAETGPYTPLPVRSAAWLSEATAEEPQPRNTRTAVVVGMVAVAVVILVAASVSLLRGSTGPPSPASTTPPMAQSTSEPSGSRSASTSPESAIPESAIPGPTVTAVTFRHGRARVELPSTWTARDETDRLILIPADLPDRRIVVTTVDLRPGTSFDDVADELIAEADRRGESGVLGDFTRATDVDGRVALSYIEVPDAESVVRWRVFVEGGLQISVGCQSRTGEEDLLDDDCARAASTLAVDPQ